MEAAKRSMVIIRNKRIPQCYSSGFVLSRGHDGTVICASECCLRGMEQDIDVCFHDGQKQDATFIVRGQESGRDFYLLRTAAYEGCEQIDWVDDDDPLIDSHTFMVVPSTPIDNIIMRTRIVLRSLASYGINPREMIPGSDNYFMVSCQYYQYTTDRSEDRLLAAPVFNMDGKAIGIVVGNCSSISGPAIKVAMKASKFKTLTWSV